jgi:glycosyltransferase involved in cell wall biosynthesis
MLEGFFVPLLLARSQPYDAVVCTSSASKRTFQELLKICAEGAGGLRRGKLNYAGQLPVIPLGVDTDLYRPRDVTDSRYQLNLPLDAFVLLWVGRLSPNTKADLLPLLRAYSLLRRRNPTCRMLLVLVGTDHENYGSFLERSAAEMHILPDLRVERTTPQHPTQLWYSASDVFVSPADNVQETFGLTLLEAMASGIPQVVSDWDGYRDIVVHGESGYRVTTYWAKCDDDSVASWSNWRDSGMAQSLLAQTVACDLGEMVRYLEFLLLSPETRYSMGTSSRKRAVELYGWNRIISLYEECWTELIARARTDAQCLARPSFIVPDFHRAFSHYASASLNDATCVRIHSNAVDLIYSAETHEQKLPIGHVNRRLLEDVLGVLAEAPRGLPFSDLCAALQAREGSGTIMPVVLRALKYGILEVVTQAQDSMPA